MEYSRTKYTIINFLSGVGVKMVLVFINFFVRTVFIKTLGIQYTGISTLFMEVLAVLSFAELGIANAITFALYKPIVDNNQKKICSIMCFYKMVYRWIALAVFFLGLCLIPFLDNLINNVPDIKEDIRLIYILYLINSASSYLLIYKSTLITASQRDYIVSRIKIIITIIKGIVECIILWVTKNFIFYLIFNILIGIVQNILISEEANKQYPYLKKKNIERLSMEEIRKLFKDVRALFLYRIAGITVTSADSMIISGFIGTSMVGYVNNYKLITNQINSLITQFFTAVTASVGNLAAHGDASEQYRIFRYLNFLTFSVYCICSAIIFVAADTFIRLWIGKDFLLTRSFLCVYVMEFFIVGMLNPVRSFRVTNGLFVQGRYRMLFMAVLNVVISIILVGYIGVTGVVIGTIISRTLTQSWYDPYLIYKNVFHVSVKHYFKKYITYTLFTFLCCTIVYFAVSNIVIENIFFDFIVRCIIAGVISLGAIIMVYRKSEEYKFFIDLIKKFLKKE